MRGVSATRNFLVIFRCYDLVLFLYSTELYRSTEGTSSMGACIENWKKEWNAMSL
jgi:hypothetical protein